MNVRVDRKVMSALSSSLKEEDSSSTAEKRIVFIRHGCTYMNEHLATPGCGWGDPNFSDVFPDEHEREMKYRDSPLSPKGVEQAKTLAKQLGDLVNGEPEAHLELSLSFEERNILKELDLVVVSPLTRALQTFEIGLWPHIQSRCTNPSELSVVAHPFAAERVYLISDHGKKHPMLQDAYGHLVDFEIGFQHMEDKEAAWWFSLDDKDIVFDSKSGTSYEHEDYEEWRPVGEGQTYACAGEPQHVFTRRMINLYQWLDERPESTIAVVCHWGVIDFMMGGADFKNCEMRVVSLNDIANRIAADGSA